MKALSIKQPWAWLIAAGHKDIENRTWQPSSGLDGQRIVIHASKLVDQLDHFHANELCRRLGITSLGEPLAYGAAIGTARVVGVYTDHQSPWFFGPFGIELADAWLWPEPVPCKGRLGLWEFPDELLPKGVRHA